MLIVLQQLQMLKLFWLQVSWVVCNQVGSLERLSYRVGFEVVFDIAEDEDILGCDTVLLGEWLLEFLTLRRLILYIYGAPILDVSRSHTTTQHSR